MFNIVYRDESSEEVPDVKLRIELEGDRTLAEILSTIEYDAMREGFLCATSDDYGGVFDVSSPLEPGQTIVLVPAPLVNNPLPFEGDADAARDETKARLTKIFGTWPPTDARILGLARP